MARDKREYEGYLTEDTFEEPRSMMFNFKYGGKTRLECLFSEFYPCARIKVTIEVLSGEVPQKELELAGAKA